MSGSPPKSESKLSEADLDIIGRYLRGPYDKALQKIDSEIQKLDHSIQATIGLREKDTGLTPSAMWNLPKDRMVIQTEPALRVGHCISIISKAPHPRYIVNFEHEGRYVVGLGKEVAPTDIEEGMRVACQRPDEIGTKLSI